MPSVEPGHIAMGHAALQHEGTRQRGRRFTWASSSFRDGLACLFTNLCGCSRATRTMQSIAPGTAATGHLYLAWRSSPHPVASVVDGALQRAAHEHAPASWQRRSACFTAQRRAWCTPRDRHARQQYAEGCCDSSLRGRPCMRAVKFDAWGRTFDGTCGQSARG